MFSFNLSAGQKKAMKKLSDIFGRLKNAVKKPQTDAPTPAPAAPAASPDFDLGYKGAPDAVKAAVQKSADIVLEYDRVVAARPPVNCTLEVRRRNEDDPKYPAYREACETIEQLLQGGLKAYGEGQGDKLQAFLSAYAPALKQFSGHSRFHSFCDQNLYPIVAQSAAPAETLAWAADAVGAEQRQECIDTLLQIACREKNLKLVEAALDAGGDACADKSSAVHSAANAGAWDILRLLHNRGVDLSANCSAHEKFTAEAMKAYRHFQLEDKMEGFRQQVADLTAQVEALKKPAPQPEAGKSATPPAQP